jgi:hypothetical protein
MLFIQYSRKNQKTPPAPYNKQGPHGSAVRSSEKYRQDICKKGRLQCSPSEKVQVSKIIERKEVVRQIFLRRRGFLRRVCEGEVGCPGDTDGGDEWLWEVLAKRTPMMLQWYSQSGTGLA